MPYKVCSEKDKCVFDDKVNEFTAQAQEADEKAGVPLPKQEEEIYFTNFIR